MSTAVPQLKRRTRFRLYLLGAFGAPLLPWALDHGWIGVPEVTLGTAYLAVVAGLAANNTGRSQPDVPPQRNDA